MRRSKSQRWSMLLLATLTGGSVFASTCETRLTQSLTNGTQLFILSLLDPSNIVFADE